MVENLASSTAISSIDQLYLSSSHGVHLNY